MEIPFLTGQQSYPQLHPTVEGGMVAKMSPLFPNEPIDLGNNVKALPTDGTVPHMPSLDGFIHQDIPRAYFIIPRKDRTLIAGDAFVTVKQEYLYKVITQEQEISGASLFNNRLESR